MSSLSTSTSRVLIAIASTITARDGNNYSRYDRLCPTPIWDDPLLGKGNARELRNSSAPISKPVNRLINTHSFPSDTCHPVDNESHARYTGRTLKSPIRKIPMTDTKLNQPYLKLGVKQYVFRPISCGSVFLFIFTIFCVTAAFFFGLGDIVATRWGYDALLPSLIASIIIVNILVFLLLRPLAWVRFDIDSFTHKRPLGTLTFRYDQIKSWEVQERKISSSTSNDMSSQSRGPYRYSEELVIEMNDPARTTYRYPITQENYRITYLAAQIVYRDLYGYWCESPYIPDFQVLLTPDASQAKQTYALTLLRNRGALKRRLSASGASSRTL